MGWFWGSKSAEGDAVRDLDPSLRKFLEEAKPAERSATSPKPAQRSTDTLGTSQPQAPSTTTKDASIVPKASLYQDGRYADIWKNYRPLSDIEAVGKTDQDRMTDLVESLNERKFQLKDAAIENCALESLAIQDCYNNANGWQMLTLCRKENKAFDRCFDMQAKFLKALGYMGQVGDKDMMERVQMHADSLYRQMIEQERRRKEAEEQGLPVPEYKPVMSKENISRAMGIGAASQREQDVWSKIKPEKRKEFEERLKGKSREDRELEMRLLESEVQMEVDSLQRLGDILKDEQEARAERKRQGKSTIGDRAKSWWGWPESECK